MPSRFIKESIRTSETLAGISAEAERLFWRLIVSADDFGRFDGRATTIIGQCLTAFHRKVNIQDVEKWLGELQDADLLQLYEFNGKRYLVITTWDDHQQRRAKSSKFPAPDDTGSHLITLDNTCNHAQTNVGSIRIRIRDRIRIRNRIRSRSRVQLKTQTPTKDESQDKPMPPLENESELTLDEYCQEIELQMVASGATPGYTAYGKALDWVKQFYYAKVPISFIRSSIVQAYAKNDDINTFTYIAKIIKDEWARELQKREPVEPLSFHVELSKSRDGPKVDREFLEQYRMED